MELSCTRKEVLGYFGPLGLSSTFCHLQTPAADATTTAAVAELRSGSLASRDPAKGPPKLAYRVRVALADPTLDGLRIQKEKDQTWVSTSDRTANVKYMTEAVRTDFGRQDLFLVTANGMSVKDRGNLW